MFGELRQRTDVAPVVLGCFGPTLCDACAETATSEFPVKILASSLDSGTPKARIPIEESNNLAFRGPILKKS